MNKRIMSFKERSNMKNKAFLIYSLSFAAAFLLMILKYGAWAKSFQSGFAARVLQ